MVTVLTAIAIGVAILAVSLWVIRMLATPPVEIDPDDVKEVDVDYRCTVCGLRLTVTHVQDTDAAPPRHCMEEMVEV
jgi:hypothetical protein